VGLFFGLKAVKGELLIKNKEGKNRKKLTERSEFKQTKGRKGRKEGKRAYPRSLRIMSLRAKSNFPHYIFLGEKRGN
jgi:hypothetical protein